MTKKIKKKKKWLDLILCGILELIRSKLKYMPEDPNKIQAKISELDTLAKPASWEEIGGNFAITRFEVHDDGSPIFLPSKGIPLKAFFNKRTGEIKIFPAKIFEKE